MTKEKATPFEKKMALKTTRFNCMGTASRSEQMRFMEALRRYSITTFEASHYLGVYYCPARILQLRKQGHKIATLWQTIETESGDIHRLGLYVLEGQQ